AILPPPNRDAIPVAAGAAPLEQPCQPADVAAALRFLLAQPVYTGQILYVDAGQHLLADTP
ncbi:MAG: short-chain dehydrogenase, partial [Candidatus Marinimicrobia bacterium]|nr:short-chain dehydrogenase [Candidatus Neomarinimicrobiota bacterium]